MTSTSSHFPSGLGRSFSTCRLSPNMAKFMSTSSYRGLIEFVLTVQKRVCRLLLSLQVRGRPGRGWGSPAQQLIPNNALWWDELRTRRDEYHCTVCRLGSCMQYSM